MSATYSTSPELRLRIADSRYPRLFKFAFCALQLAGLWLMVRAGAWHWVASVIAFLLVLVWCQRRQTAKPCPVDLLCWRKGRWWVESAGDCRDIELLRWHCQPWCTYLAWREPDGERGDAWLFNDSAGREDLRRLRVRLTLQGGA